MTRGRMIRIPSNLMVAIIIMACVFFSISAFPKTVFGQWEIVQKPTDYPASVDPYEVIVYEHANFVGSYIRFKLLPGMRQLLVPVIPESMNDRISSIQVGSKVAAFVFHDAYFMWGYPNIHIFKSSQKVLKTNDLISSIIVFPKEWDTPIGVMLIDVRSSGGKWQFIPLPQDANDSEAKYARLPYMDDDINRVRLYPLAGSPMYGEVRVTLYEHPEFMGRWITLPGADGSIPSDGTFYMNTYQFDDTASSLIVRWTGPPPPLQVQLALAAPPPPPSTSVRVSAPQAPDTKQAPSDRTPPPPDSPAAKVPSDKTAPLPPAAKVIITDISGQWNSNIGVVYEIQQSGNNFTWSVPSLNQSGTGTISGSSVTMSGPGWTVKGTITETDASGRPTKIVGENGVVIFRAAQGPAVPAPSPAQPPIPLPPPAPAVAINPLSGQWNSNIGVVYEIQQSGNNFTWSVPSLNQSGTGTISGSSVTMSGPGWTVKGTITETDSSGRPTKIVGENGVILFRPSSGKG